MFWCRHKWEVKDKTVLESGFEQIKKSGSRNCRIERFSPELFEKAVLIVLVCEKCGKLRTVTERNPDQGASGW